MAPKKKHEGKKKQKQEKETESDAERLARLSRDNDILTETLNNLKQRSAHLRRENAILQEEADQIRLDSQEYASYMMKCAQKRQNAMDALNNQMQQKLEEISRQREEMVKKHTERLNCLKKKTMEKVNEMVPLQRELADLGNLASVQQKHLDCLTELEQKVSDARSHHLQAFNNLKEKSDKKLYQIKTEAQRRMLEHLAITTEEQSTVSQKLSEENRYLNAELHQLTQRAQALRNYKEHLEMRRLQLLNEKELYTSPASVRQKHLDCLTELEQKVSDARSHHLQAFNDLEEKSDKKLYQIKTEAQRRMLEHFAITTEEQSTVSQKLSEENRYLNAELHQLTQRAQALRNYKEHLEMRRLQLLNEKELYTSPAVSSKCNGESTRE